jgi:methionine-rich copper-binding protein CopC
VQLWFNEVPDIKVSKIDVTGPLGKLELGPAHVMDGKAVMAPITGDVPNGKYTTAWRTAGKDGHVIKGQFVFTVMRPH